MGVDKGIYLGPYIECPKGPDAWDALELCEESLFRASSMGDYIVRDKEIFLPNHALEGIERNTDVNDVEGVLELAGVDADYELTMFKKQYDKELSILARLYGIATVRWGIVVTWN